jgi:hypothetical protein
MEENRRHSRGISTVPLAMDYSYSGLMLPSEEKPTKVRYRTIHLG